MKRTLFVILFFSFSCGLFAQDKAKDEVKKVLASYKTAMEKLDKQGVRSLFSDDAVIYENGSPGEPVSHFMSGHLYPEFDMFSSFTYNDYKADIIVSGNYAYSTEAYTYTIVLKKDGKPIVPSSMGVVTAVLKKTSSGWKFISYHSSYRKKKS
ncbi:MAG: nuclear transport factor 2 family protein [Flavipsychrobacter sp.]|nr:nuclear transport factor 2 family protein [Flavipsychrobacter sp.]